MKRTLHIVLACMFLSLQASSASIVIEGFYQGKDIYVKNPVDPSGVGFSVYEVQVNGEITADEINSSAFIVDLHTLGLEIGDPVTVSILHHDNSQPKILNPEVILPQSTYEVESISMDPDGILKWVTTKEMGELPYKIQQFKWNKWVTIGEVGGIGRMTENSYSFKVELHSGKNTLRVAQTSSDGKLRYTESVYANNPNTVELVSELKKVNDEIQFSRMTNFEIYDAYGRMVKRGFTDTIDVKRLEKGQYYLNYDRAFGSSFFKK